MLKKLAIVSIIVLVLSLAFASISFAQSGTGSNSSNNNSSNNNSSHNNSSHNNNSTSKQGSGPDNAFMSLGNGSRALKTGEQQWYAFQYAGDGSQIQIRLSGSNMQFSVWTQQDVQNAAGSFGASANPVGRSTANTDFYGGDQFWSGSFNTPGTYYVMVENANGGQGGNYTFQITGGGVSFGAANNNASTSNKASTSNNASTSSKTSSSNTAIGTSSTSKSSTSASTSGKTPTTLPHTGGEMASVIPMLIGGAGALTLTAGALLRRKK